MIRETAKFSLTMQFIAILIDIWGLQLKLDPKHQILRELLQLEIIVQIVEFIFYMWLLRNLHRFNNITPFRYIDWMITTPTMLIQLMTFLHYDIYSSTSDFITKYKKDVYRVIVLNWTMMIIGYLGETKQISMDIASIAGFVPFTMYFHLIYTKFVPKQSFSYQDTVKRSLFFYYLIVWSLYGVVSFLPYILKNSTYNILDVFAKNVYGLFLVWYIIKLQKNTLPN